MISLGASQRAAATMVLASVFIAVSTFLAKGVSGHFAIPGNAPGIHPVQITAGRFLFAWLLWSLVIAVRRPTFTTIHWRLQLVRTTLGWITVLCVFWASSLMALADATAISFLTPVATLLLAVLFLNEKVGRVRLSAVAIMLCGALILLRPGTAAFQPAALIALLAAVTSAMESVFIKKLTALEGRLQVLFINNTIGGLIALLTVLFIWQSPTTEQWIAMAGVGLSMTIAQVFFLTSMRDGDASFVIPFMYSTLVFAALLDYAVFGDAPDIIGAVGAAVIVLGAVFLAWREATR